MSRPGSVPALPGAAWLCSRLSPGRQESSSEAGPLGVWAADGVVANRSSKPQLPKGWPRQFGVAGVE
jgi:hypothetical protein